MYLPPAEYIREKDKFVINAERFIPHHRMSHVLKTFPSRKAAADKKLLTSITHAAAPSI